MYNPNSVTVNMPAKSLVLNQSAPQQVYLQTPMQYFYVSNGFAEGFLQLPEAYYVFTSQNYSSRVATTSYYSPFGLANWTWFANRWDNPYCYYFYNTIQTNESASGFEVIFTDGVNTLYPSPNMTKVEFPDFSYLLTDSSGNQVFVPSLSQVTQVIPITITVPTNYTTVNVSIVNGTAHISNMIVLTTSFEVSAYILNAFNYTIF